MKQGRPRNHFKHFKFIIWKDDNGDTSCYDMRKKSKITYEDDIFLPLKRNFQKNEQNQVNILPKEEIKVSHIENIEKYLMSSDTIIYSFPQLSETQNINYSNTSNDGIRNNFDDLFFFETCNQGSVAYMNIGIDNHIQESNIFINDKSNQLIESVHDIII